MTLMGQPIQGSRHEYKAIAGAVASKVEAAEVKLEAEAPVKESRKTSRAVFEEP